MDVGGNAGSPRSRETHRTTIGEGPGVEVAAGLQLIAGVVVVDVAIELNLAEPLSQRGAETQAESLADGGLARGVLHRRGIHVECHVAYVVVVAQVGERVDIPDAGAVDGCVEHAAPEHIPVAVDVLRTRGTATGFLVVGHHRRDAVVGGGEAQEGHLCHRVVLLIAVVEEVQALRERWFQAGITARDVERVAIVVDIEQLRHRGLRRRSAVVDAQVGHLREAVAEVECRGDVEHGAGGVDIDALIVLYELRALRLEHHAHVEVVLLVNLTEHQLDVVRVVLILRVAAQCRVAIGLVGLRKAIQVVVPLTIVRSKSREEVLAEIGEVEGLSVALVERVVEAIAKLQERAFPKRFAISGLQRVVVALRGGEVEAVGLVGRVVAQHVLNLEEMHVAGREILRRTVIIGSIGT